ncbi:MAG: DJ-1/PfpI family protein [Methylococcales bacterium]|nr:DJ-1/PfpI family protein [Methylococcales bacterium]
MKIIRLLCIALLLIPFGSIQAATPVVTANMEETMAFLATKSNPDVSKNGIGIFVYDGVNSLDAIGPYKVFKSAGMKTFLIAEAKGTIKTGDGLVINVDKSIDEVDVLDILVVPGGTTETITLTKNQTVIDWIRKIDETSVYTTSVCTGSWVLGAADLLKGKKATSNWYRAKEVLTKFGARYQKKRWVHDGKYWTSAGVTAGTDMALAIVLELYGKDYALGIAQDLEYAPAPPVSLSKITPKTKAIMEYMYDYYLLNSVQNLKVAP